MYKNDTLITFQKETNDWLENKKTIAIDTVEGLRSILRFHEHRYYVENNPLISDGEYDRLFDLLLKFEKENPLFVTKDSPTQRVGAGLIKDFPKTTHLVPMLSLENSYNEEDLLDWDRKVREGANLEAIEYSIEPKFDGASVSLLYENNMLTRGVTRGDGQIGDDITPNIQQIKSIPLSAKFSDYNIKQIEIGTRWNTNSDRSFLSTYMGGESNIF